MATNYKMPEARNHVAPERLEEFDQELADLEAKGYELKSAIISRGVVLVYNISEKEA